MNSSWSGLVYTGIAKIGIHLTSVRGVLVWLWGWRAEYCSSSLSCMRMAITRSPDSGSCRLLARMLKLDCCVAGKLPLLSYATRGVLQGIA